MKKIIASLVLAGLTAAAFAQAAPAPQNQIDLGLGYYGTDITGVYANAYGSAFGQSAKYSPSLNGSGKYTFTYKLDDADTLKFALGYDGWLGLYKGSSSSATAPGASSPGDWMNAGEAGQNAGKVTPIAEYVGYGADVVLSFPIYYYGAADNAGFSELKYAYGEAGYMPTTVNKNGYAISSNNVLATTELMANYKYSFDKTTWVLGQIDTLMTLNPAPWLTFVKPKVSGAAYGVQLDVQFDYFNGFADKSGSNYYDTFLEPKLTYDLGFLNLVAGLKTYVASKISLATTASQYTVSGSAQPFHNSWLQPGASYSFAVKDVGTFGIDAGWRFNKFDNVGSVGTPAGSGKASYTGVGSNANDVAPYSELRIATTYSVKF